MTRKEIQDITIRSLKREIEKNGPDATFLEIPKLSGCCRWSLADALTAAESDECLEGSESNPVTDMEHFLAYLEERGESWTEVLDL